MAAYTVRYRKAVTYVAVDGSFAGFLALSDTLRQESAETIAALSGLGVQPVLLTGDHENAVRRRPPVSRRRSDYSIHPQTVPMRTSD